LEDIADWFACGTDRGCSGRIDTVLSDDRAVVQATGRAATTDEKRQNVEVSGPFIAVVTAVGICALNTVVGYVVARKAFGKDLNMFLAMVFGSLGVRSIAVLAAAWFCLSVLAMHKVAFALTFAIVGFVLLMGEILFFHRSYEQSKRQVRRPVTEFLKKKVADMFIGLRYHAVPCLS
jgi:hypothetical protein